MSLEPTARLSETRTSRVPLRRVLPRPAPLPFSPTPSLTCIMFPSSGSFQSSASGGVGQEQRSPFQHSHSHSVQYNGSPFSVAGMSNLNQSTSSPSVRGGAMGMSMGSSLGMGSPLSEGLSQSRSHYQPGYLMVRAPRFSLIMGTVLTHPCSLPASQA